jgi:hypothetical protein
VKAFESTIKLFIGSEVWNGFELGIFVICESRARISDEEIGIGVFILSRLYMSCVLMKLLLLLLFFTKNASIFEFLFKLSFFEDIFWFFYPYKFR